MLNLEEPVGHIKGIGPKISMAMNSIGISSIGDLLTHFPRCYEDRSIIKPISGLKDGETAAVAGEVSLIDRDRYTGTGKVITRIVLKNDTGFLVGVWYNQRFMRKNFKIGEKCLFYGVVTKMFTEMQIVNPEYEKIDGDMPKGIIPVYPAAKNLSQKIIRGAIGRILSELDTESYEIIPESIRQKYGLCSIYYALKNIHFPDSMDRVAISTKRIKFEELLVLQLGLMLEKRDIDTIREGISFSIAEGLKDFISDLPFKLTDAQNKALGEVLGDMKLKKPMNRLLQGDVGSGKTVIAVIALFNAVKNGYQGAMMAPTEILASQHMETLKSFLSGFGIRIELLSSKVPKKRKDEIKQGIKDGSIDIVVGTHAIIQGDVEFNNLGLVITDEQHRFGVRQRALLGQKGKNPDVLVMTATPIPRTMALFVYGDLDISIIDELPPGRQKIDTFVVRPVIRQRIYNFVRKEIKAGRQAYVVCPLIDESDAYEAESAIQMEEKLKKEFLFGLSVGLLHGKMKPQEKDDIMTDFNEGRISVLVSTTVIEVGINVPNASIMIVENADRFGLSQLHQLRGRVGRGQYKSCCILISDMKTDNARDRMQAMRETENGFEIAEKDLKLRGTGEFFGTRQHGLPELKMADIFADVDILKVTNSISRELVSSGKIYEPEFDMLRETIEKKFGDRNEKIAFN